MRHSNHHPIVGVVTIVAVFAVVTATVMSAAGPSATKQEGDFVTYAEMNVEFTGGAWPAPASESGALKRPRALPSFIALFTYPLSSNGRSHADLGSRSRVVNLTMPARKITRVVEHGTDASGHMRREVVALIGCWFTIEDLNGYEWDFTYDARIFSPSNSEIKFKTDYATDRSSWGDTVTASVTDPDEGDYTCRIRWAVGYYWLDTEDKVLALTYDIPTGEESIPMGWATFPQTYYRFNAQLHPAEKNFTGRRIKEEDPGGGVDGCHRDGDPVEEYKAISPRGTWPVQSSNIYGPDEIGYGTNQVDWYRQHSTGRLPCNAEIRQRLLISRGSDYQEYRTNTLKAGIEVGGGLWVERDGVRSPNPSPY